MNDVKKVVQTEIGVGLDAGLRRKSNQDNLVAVNLKLGGHSENKSVKIFAVADGMGGQSDGDLAAQLALQTAVREILGNIAELDYSVPPNYQNWLRSAVTIANRVVYQRARANGSDMGTTLVMAAVVDDNIHIVNVGDSRAYLITDERIRKITKDHSFVQSLVDAGAIDPEEAIGHPRSNLLTQSIGTDATLEIDTFEETLQQDSYLLLCSDGLWNMVPEQTIFKLVTAAESAQAGCEALVSAANEAGGKDNIAVVLVMLPARGNGKM